MADDPNQTQEHFTSVRKTKPEPPQQDGSVISMADRDQERRHAAARRLAERHNAALRQAPEDAA
jgi:hypothetical protein